MPSSRSKCEKKGRVYVKKHKAYKDGPEIKSQCRKSKSRKSKSRSKKEKKGVKKSAEQEFRSLVKEICKNQAPSDLETPEDQDTPGEPRSISFGRGGLEYRPEPVARRPFDEIDNSMLGVFDY